LAQRFSCFTTQKQTFYYQPQVLSGAIMKSVTFLAGFALARAAMDVEKCDICPSLQTFDDPQFHQNCPDQARFQWIKDLIKKGCNQVWKLEAKTYYIDRQYLLPCGVQVEGSGSGPKGTIIKAVRCEEPSRDYGLGTNGTKYRIGFVLNSNTRIKDLRFEGDDTKRYAKHGSNGTNYTSEGYTDLENTNFTGGSVPGGCHGGGNGFSDLQGGAGFETPGCSDPYACSQTPCINGLFTTPAGYKWDPVESIAIKNAAVENIVSVNTNVGFFGAPVNEHLGVGLDSFDISKLRPSKITISNFVNEHTLADGLNLHGSFHEILIDGYRSLRSGDDGIALWSYHAHMGAVTIQNSFAGHNSYMGCYPVYGGSGPIVYKNVTCAATGHSRRKCLWLQEQFDGQFASTTRVSATDMECNGWPCDGNKKSLCPFQETAVLV